MIVLLSVMHHFDNDFRNSFHINDLPDDCLFMIFGYFDLIERMRLETVCRRWRRVLLIMWKSLSSLKIVQTLENRNYADLKSITFSQYCLLTDNILASIIQRTQGGNLSCLSLAVPKYTCTLSKGIVSSTALWWRDVAAVKKVTLADRGLQCLLNHLTYLRQFTISRTAKQLMEESQAQLQKQKRGFSRHL